MKIDVRSSAPLKFQTPCLVVSLFQDEKLSGSALRLDRALDGLLAEVTEQDGFKAGAGETRVLYSGGKVAAPRLILLGLGKRVKVSTATLRNAAAKGARAVRSLKRDSFAITVPDIEAFTGQEIGAALVEGIELGLHLFNEFKTDDETKNLTQIASATLLAENAVSVGSLKEGVTFGALVSSANMKARRLVNLPSNLKSPQLLAETAQQIAQQSGLRCEVWDEHKIAEEKMGALFAVGMGSDNLPRFIILEHAPKGTQNDAPIILVGKGISFDTGGYSIKGAAGMEDMKDDIGGAAAVLGAMSVVKEVAPNTRVLALVASAENMINGRAQRPGDIVTARNGKTIEVLNTDAEGRLVLADALSYASEQNPKLILDFATLTGAISIALGQEAAGLFSSDDALVQRVRSAGDKSGERVWPLPMWDEYRDYMKGTVSDLKNMGPERRGGSIAAAIFLQSFVPENVPWAHLDIAAVAFIREDRPLTQRGATGFGTGLILQFLKDG